MTSLLQIAPNVALTWVPISDGLFNVRNDGAADFSTALQLILAGKMSISESFGPHVKARKRITLDELTQKEEVVLSA